MNQLRIINGDPIDNRLVESWDNGNMNLHYDDYVKSLDPNIISVEVEGPYDAIVITFEKEEDITWFLMRW